MATAEYIRLAEKLPPRLLRFFARYPPGSVKPPFAASSSTVSTSSASEHHPPEQELTSSPSLPHENPFQPTKNPITGAWRDPVYSLRRQADLVKLARDNGVEELLPFTTKGTRERQARQEEKAGKMMNGRKVKGHHWERTQKGRLEKRRQAMAGMPELIRTWKERGHGRGWKKFPR